MEPAKNAPKKLYALALGIGRRVLDHLTIAVFVTPANSTVPPEDCFDRGLLCR
jgi:hypothetical protein